MRAFQLWQLSLPFQHSRLPASRQWVYWPGSTFTYVVILDDLGDEVTGVRQVGNDGHPHAQNQDIGVLLEKALHQRLKQHSLVITKSMHIATGRYTE